MENQNNKLVKVLKMVLWSIIMIVVGFLSANYMVDQPENEDFNEPAVVETILPTDDSQAGEMSQARLAAYDTLAKFYNDDIQAEYDSFKAEKYTRLNDLIDTLLQQSLTGEDSSEIYDLINLIYGEIEKLEITI